jgi:hypothetical protein
MSLGALAINAQAIMIVLLFRLEVPNEQISQAAGHFFLITIHL